MMMSRSVHKFSQIFLTGFVLLLLGGMLGGCSTVSDIFGEEEDAPLPGERVSILELQKSLKPESTDQGFELPKVWRNEYWPQQGGYPSHAMQHVAFTQNRPELFWTADIGQGSTAELPLTAAPIVVNGRIYTLDTDFRLSAYRVDSGRKLWELDVASEDEDDPVIGGGLAYSRGRIYVTNGYNELLAINPEDGEIFWRAELPAPSRAAPTVMDGRVYITTMDNRLLAVNGEDGSILWEYSGISESSALVGAASPAASGSVVIPAFSSGEVFALRAENGTVAWGENLSSFRYSGGLSGISDIRALPIIDRGIVYAISFSGRMVAIDERSGDRLWERQIGSSETPWVAGEHIFVVTNENEIVALNRLDGTVLWVQQLPRYEDVEDKEGPVFWTGPIIAGGRLLVAGTNGRVFEMDPASGKTIRTWDAGHPVAKPLVVAGETLYMLAEDGTLLAYR